MKNMNKFAVLSLLFAGLLACPGPLEQQQISVSFGSLHLSRLSAEQIGLLRATLQMPGLSAGSESSLDVIEGDGGKVFAKGSFDLDSDSAGSIPLTLRLYGRFSADSDEVLLARLQQNIEIKAGETNKPSLDANAWLSDGEAIFDLNRNGDSNLLDMQNAIDPAPPAPFFDAAPATLEFFSGIRLGSFERRIVLLQNNSADTLQFKARLFDAAGVLLVPVDAAGASEESSQAKRELDMEIPPFGERFVGVSFAPMNKYLTTGSLLLQAYNARSKVTQSQRVKLLANTGGNPQPAPVDYNPAAIAVDASLGDIDPLQVQNYPADALFSGLVLSASESHSHFNQTLSRSGAVIKANDGAEIMPADRAILVEVPAGHRFSATLAGLASDVDLGLFVLDDDDNIQLGEGQYQISASPESGPEALALRNERDTALRALIVLGRHELEVQHPQIHALSDADGVPFALSAHVVSGPEFDEIEPINPTRGPIEGGDLVVLRGRGFQPGASVRFADIEAVDSSVNASGTEIHCTLPPGSLEIGKNPATVVVVNPSPGEGGDGQAATLPEAFTYLPPAPRLNQVQPSRGLVNAQTTVTLRGSFFSNRFDGPVVRFGDEDVPAADVTFVNPSELSVRSPAHSAGEVEIRVFNYVAEGQLSTSPDSLTFTFVASSAPAPLISGVNPATGSIDGGTQVTINGSNFVAGSLVRFGNSSAASLTIIDSNTLSAYTPEHTSGDVDVTVINPDGQSVSLARAFTFFIPPPQISDVYPPFVSLQPQFPGEQRYVSVNGAGFRAGAQVTFVKDGHEISADSVAFISSTYLRVAAPSVTEEGEYTLKATNPDGQFVEFASVTFSAPAGPAPQISGISPAVLSAGQYENLNISGQNFVSGTFVSIESGEVTVNAVSATQIQCTVLVGQAGQFELRVLNPDGQYASIMLSFVSSDAPSLSAVIPSQVHAEVPGEQIVIFGEHLKDAESVCLMAAGLVGENLCYDNFVRSDSSLRLALPQVLRDNSNSMDQPYDIQVSFVNGNNGEAVQAVLPAALTAHAPRIFMMGAEESDFVVPNTPGQQIRAFGEWLNPTKITEISFVPRDGQSLVFTAQLMSATESTLDIILLESMPEGDYVCNIRYLESVEPVSSGGMIHVGFDQGPGPQPGGFDCNDPATPCMDEMHCESDPYGGPGRCVSNNACDFESRQALNCEQDFADTTCVDLSSPLGYGAPFYGCFAETRHCDSSEISAAACDISQDCLVLPGTAPTCVSACSQVADCNSGERCVGLGDAAYCLPSVSSQDDCPYATSNVGMTDSGASKLCVNALDCMDSANAGKLCTYFDFEFNETTFGVCDNSDNTNDGCLPGLKVMLDYAQPDQWPLMFDADGNAEAQVNLYTSGEGLLVSEVFVAGFENNSTVYNADFIDTNALPLAQGPSFSVPVTGSTIHLSAYNDGYENLTGLLVVDSNSIMPRVGALLEAESMPPQLSTCSIPDMGNMPDDSAWPLTPSNGQSVARDDEICPDEDLDYYQIDMSDGEVQVRLWANDAQPLTMTAWCGAEVPQSLSGTTMHGPAYTSGSETPAMLNLFAESAETCLIEVKNDTGRYRIEALPAPQVFEVEGELYADGPGIGQTLDIYGQGFVEDDKVVLQSQSASPMTFRAKALVLSSTHIQARVEVGCMDPMFMSDTAVTVTVERAPVGQEPGPSSCLGNTTLCPLIEIKPARLVIGEIVVDPKQNYSFSASPTGWHLDPSPSIDDADAYVSIYNAGSCSMDFTTSPASLTYLHIVEPVGPLADSPHELGNGTVWSEHYTDGCQASNFGPGCALTISGFAYSFNQRYMSNFSLFRQYTGEIEIVDSVQLGSNGVPDGSAVNGTFDAIHRYPETADQPGFDSPTYSKQEGQAMYAPPVPAGYQAPWKIMNITSANSSTASSIAFDDMNSPVVALGYMSSGTFYQAEWWFSGGQWLEDQSVVLVDNSPVDRIRQLRNEGSWQSTYFVANHKLWRVEAYATSPTLLHSGVNNFMDVVSDPINSSVEHVAFETSSNELFYGSWDSNRSAGQEWQETNNLATNAYALAIVLRNNQPEIYYRDNMANLYYRAFNGSTWTAATDLQIGGVNGLSAKSDGSDVHLALYRYDNNNNENYLFYSINGQTLELVDDSAPEVGYDCAIAIDVNNAPHIVYRVNKNVTANVHEKLRYARFDSYAGLWQTQTIDSQTGTGLSPSIVVDYNGNPHVSYYNSSNYRIMYATP